MMINDDEFGWFDFIHTITDDDEFFRNECLINHPTNNDKFLLLCPIRFRQPNSIIKLCNDYVNKLWRKCSQINGKDTGKSIEYRSIGNEYYSNGLWNKCLYVYSQSLRYASANDESLPFALGNRMQANFQLARYEQSLLDINSAIEYGYENYKPVNKLRKRQVECLLRLNRLDEARKIFDEFCIDFPTTTTNSKPMISSNLKMKEPDVDQNIEKIGLFSSKVRLSWNDQNGRGVWSGPDHPIESNETILAEHPYVHVLLPFSEHKYCHHCCRRLPIDDDQFEICYKCSNVSYCSHECRNVSWQQYHQYECMILPFLWQFGIGHLVFRLMAKTNTDLILNTYRTLMNESNAKIEQNVQSFLLPSDDDSAALHQSTYQSLFSLQTHQNHTEPMNLVAYRITAMIIIELLIRTDRYPKNQMEQQILTDICFRHLCQTVINSHTIMIPDVDGNGDSIPIATAFYPALSLLNHSCDPNIEITYKNGIECIVRSKRTIQPNEQIFNCYGINHHSHDYNNRQQLLLDQYFFHCKCHICQQKDLNQTSKDSTVRWQP